MIMGSIKINQEGFRNLSNLIFNFSVLYWSMFLYTRVCHCALKSILEYVNLYSSMQFPEANQIGRAHV